MGTCLGLPNGESDTNAVGMTNVAIDEALLAATSITGHSDVTTRVELSISCRNLINKDILSLSDPFCVVYRADDGRFTEVLRTEIVSNTINPDFITKVVMVLELSLVVTRDRIITSNEFKAFDSLCMMLTMNTSLV